MEQVRKGRSGRSPSRNIQPTNATLSTHPYPNARPPRSLVWIERENHTRFFRLVSAKPFPPTPAHARLGQVLSGLGESEEMDLAQFKKVVESMGLGWSDRQVEDLFDALDRDGNGRIEVDEINGKGWFK